MAEGTLYLNAMCLRRGQCITVKKGKVVYTLQEIKTEFNSSVISIEFGQEVLAYCINIKYCL